MGTAYQEWAYASGFHLLRCLQCLLVESSQDSQCKQQVLLTTLSVMADTNTSAKRDSDVTIVNLH